MNSGDWFALDGRATPDATGVREHCSGRREFMSPTNGGRSGETFTSRDIEVR